MSRGATPTPPRGAVKSGRDQRPAVRGSVSRQAPPHSTQAQQSKTAFSDISSSYWRHHLQECRNTLWRLLASPIQTAMTALVVAIALALPVILLLALSNLQVLGNGWDASPKVSVYLNARSKPAAIDALMEQLRARTEVAKVLYISPEQALNDFQRLSGFGEAVSQLDENPLPPSLEVTPVMSAVAAINLADFAAQIQQHPIVDQAVVDMDWVQRLLEFMALGKTLVISLASLLALGALVAVGNTIRLAIENRRDEIVIAKLVGATNAFVRRPFLYTGIWYGLLGGVIATLIIAIGFALIAQSVQRLVALYGSTFILQGLDILGVVKLLLFSALLGWLGAWLAVARHLSSIEPK